MSMSPEARAAFGEKMKIARAQARELRDRDKALAAQKAASRAEAEAARERSIADFHGKAVDEPRRTAGRPASRPVEMDDDGNPITRRSRATRELSAFDVPREFRKSGWDYEWKTITVFNEPVDPSDITEMYDAGWRPVKASDMPKMVPPGWDRPYIERQGQRLVMRPQYLTDEARAEDAARADEQKMSKMRAAMAGPEEELRRGVVRHVDKFEIDGEVGIAAPK